MAEKVRLYKKRSVTVEGLRWDGTNRRQMHDFTDGNFRVSKWVSAQVFNKLSRSWVRVAVGDTVLRGTQGEFFPVDSGELSEYTEIR